MNLKALIVDDEAKSRTLLKRLCEEYCEGLMIIDAAASVKEAIDKIKTGQPELIFLDIQMPLQSGFDLLEHYGENIPFEIIFTTAYDQYAIKAFHYAAADYLLKPINVDELTEAVDRVKARIAKTTGNQHLVELKRQLGKKEFNKIALTTTEGFTFVELSEIIRCEAEGNYTSIHLKDGQTHLITKTLKHYEEILSDRNFFRIHKSHLINLDNVRRFVKGRQGQVEMVDGKKVEVSTRKKESLLLRLDGYNR